MTPRPARLLVSAVLGRQLAMLAMVFVMLSVVISRAVASPLRQLTASTIAFASDGSRYAAWQASEGSPIVVLDTVTGQRRDIAPPPGCKLHDEAEDGEPIVSAAAGRFLLDGCGKELRRALLDARTGKTVLLPEKSSSWYRVGTRYVMGVNVLYDIATGVTTRLTRPADLDARGASMKAICPAVRHLASRYQPRGLLGRFAYQRELFAQGYGKHGDVQLDRCQGHPTILRARGTDEFGRGAPEDFDLRGGLLSWDTGSDATDYIPPERPFRGSLDTYELTTHRLQKWLLPRLRVLVGGERIGGTYGYSTHTANTVFWIAARTAEAGGPGVETSTVYAASLK